MRAGRRAFTLVELLVVVSIIALLIAILLPSLRKAREQAKLAVCSSSMTGVSKASHAYATDDPGENVIPVADITHLDYASGDLEWGGKAGSGESTSPGDPAYSWYGTAYWRGPAHRPLNALIYKSGFKNYNPIGGIQNPGPGGANWRKDTQLDLPDFRCPSDTGYAGGGFTYIGGRHQRDERPFAQEGLTAYDHFGTSYSANMFFIVGGSMGLQVRSQSPYLTPLSRIPTPQETIAYEEWPARFAWLWGDWSDEQCSWTNRDALVVGDFNTIPGWHRRDFNFVVAFADGHSAVAEMKGCFRPPPNLGVQNYPHGVCGPSVDPYDCDACVTIRGPGWRLDTLPAHAIATSWFADGY